MLLSDTLEQVLAEPQCVLIWHHLFELWRKAHDDEARQQVLQKLLTSVLSDPRAEILRLTFLAAVTEDNRFIENAAIQTLCLPPSNPDRLAGFIAYSWGFALKNQVSRDSFVATLVRFMLPDLAARLAHNAVALLPDNLPPRLPQTIERIAVIAPYLGNEFHTPSSMVANQCEVLAREGKGVYVFSCQELLPPDMTLFSGSTDRVILAPFEIPYWQKALPPGTKLTCSDNTFSLARRWREMFSLIAAFDPDAILFCGLYSPLAAALYSRRPVVGLNVHALPPMSPVDVWLSSDDPSAPHNPWNNIFGTPKNYFHPYRIKSMQGPWSISRADLGIADDAIIWITVGGRLESEIIDPWAKRIGEVLNHNPQLIWLLVGGPGHLPAALSHLPTNRIKLLAKRNDIGDLLQLSDIYLNPPRMGGGYSVAEAMSVGLPVVSFADCDGGDKMGAYAARDIDDYLVRLSELTQNPDLRKQIGEELLERFTRRLDLASSGPSLLAAFDQAKRCAQDRLCQTSLD